MLVVTEIECKQGSSSILHAMLSVISLFLCMGVFLYTYVFECVYLEVFLCVCFCVCMYLSILYKSGEKPFNKAITII